MKQGLFFNGINVPGNEIAVNKGFEDTTPVFAHRANLWPAPLADVRSERPVYCAGLGCERGCGTEELRDLFDDCLQRAGLKHDRIASINSIDIKADEAGLIALGESIGKPFRVFNRDQLQHEDGLLSTRSDYVYATVGVYGVAESAALHAARTLAGNTPELVLAKQKSRRATCAIARAYPRLDRQP